MAWNLPDGCTDDDIDRAHGEFDEPEPEPEPEDPENEYPLVPCAKCHDYPCRCLRDEMEAEAEPTPDCPF